MAGSLLLFLVLQGAAQEFPETKGLTLAVREVPGDPKPLLACEGTTDLPDNARLELTLYYGIYHPGMYMGTAAVMVKEGKYAHAFRRFASEHTTFPDRNMAGDYLFQVVFQPGYQKSRALGKLPRREVRKILRIGTAADARRDQETVRFRMVDQAREVAAIAKEILTTAASRSEEFGTPKWKSRIEGWSHRGLDIFRAATSVPEYRALKIQALTGELEAMLKYNKQLAYFAERRNVGALRQGRAAVAQAVQDFKRRLAFRRLTHQETADIAAAAQKVLKESAALSGEELGAARRKFIESIMTLGSAEPTRPHGPRITKLVETTRPYFEAKENGDSDADRLRTELDSELSELIRLLKKETPVPEEE